MIILSIIRVIRFKCHTARYSACHSPLAKYVKPILRNNGYLKSQNGKTGRALKIIKSGCFQPCQTPYSHSVKNIFKFLLYYSEEKFTDNINYLYNKSIYVIYILFHILWNVYNFLIERKENDL